MDRVLEIDKVNGRVDKVGRWTGWLVANRLRDRWRNK